MDDKDQYGPVEYTSFRKFVRKSFAALFSRLDAMERNMTTASDNLSAKVADLFSAQHDAITQIESEVATIKATDDSDAVNASADKIASMAASLRAAVSDAQSALAPAPAAAAAPVAPTPDPVAAAAVPAAPVQDSTPAAAPAVTTPDTPETPVAAPVPATPST